jgi:hypothetical protein
VSTLFTSLFKTRRKADSLYHSETGDRLEGRGHDLLAPLRGDADSEERDADDQPRESPRAGMGYTGAFDDERDAWNG